jgi:hypothetical protein
MTERGERLHNRALAILARSGKTFEAASRLEYSAALREAQHVSDELFDLERRVERLEGELLP